MSEIRGAVAHAGCQTCAECFDGARSVMQCTGSVEVTHRDGDHFATATRVTDEDEVRQLREEQRALYYEAVGCGATHNDAMEAAETEGYAR